MIDASRTKSRPVTEINLTEEQKERFWASIKTREPAECWEWQKGTRGKGIQGYGCVRFHKKVYQSHRIAWILTNGIIPDDGSPHGICVCHKCDNPLCCNPGHLFLGTHKENSRDMFQKGRGVITPCPIEKISRGEGRPQSKLTEEKVKEARLLYAKGGITKAALAKKYSVARTIMSSAIRRTSWKHVP